MNQAGANPIHFFIQIGIIAFIFFFLIIKPQKAKQAEHKKMLSELQKNDSIITSGGIHGTVVNVKEVTVVIRVDDNTRIEIQKDAISAKKKQS